MNTNNLCPIVSFLYLIGEMNIFKYIFPVFFIYPIQIGRAHV